MTDSLFIDLIEIANANVSIATARIRELADYSDSVHAAALERRAASRVDAAKGETLAGNT